MSPVRIGEGNLHFLVDGLRCSSHAGTPHRNTQSSVELNRWIPLDPVKLTHRVNHHTGKRIGSVYKSHWGKRETGEASYWTNLSTQLLQCLLILFLTIVLLSWSCYSVCSYVRVLFKNCFYKTKLKVSNFFPSGLFVCLFERTQNPSNPFRTFYAQNPLVVPPDVQSHSQSPHHGVESSGWPGLSHFSTLSSITAPSLLFLLFLKADMLFPISRTYPGYSQG